MATSPNLDFNVEDEHQITLIDITRQESTIAQPSRPRVRLDIEHTIADVVEPDLDLLFNISVDFDDFIPLPQADNSSSYISANPQRSARVFRIVEPVTPQWVIQQEQRFRVYVDFIIDHNGNIEDVFVTEIRKFDRDLNSFIPIQESQQDIVEATLDAAVQWRFRPAEENGVPVRSISSHLFTFGR